MQWCLLMDDGELLIRWSIRLCLLLYALVLAGGLLSWGRIWPRTMRYVWTAAGGLFAVHVVAAMHFYHGWSHQHAFEDTAQQTEQLIGAEFGYGIYFSYFFGVVWLIDIGWMWIAGEHYFRQTPLLRRTIHAYMLFIAINGAVIFHSGWIRWTGVAVLLLLAALAVYVWLRASTQVAEAK